MKTPRELREVQQPSNNLAVAHEALLKRANAYAQELAIVTAERDLYREAAECHRRAMAAHDGWAAGAGSSAGSAAPPPGKHFEAHRNNLEELRAIVDRLHALLHDPYPGLFTWCEALIKARRDFLRFHGVTDP
jgi:hypothetical protein